MNERVGSKAGEQAGDNCPQCKTGKIRFCYERYPWSEGEEVVHLFCSNPSCDWDKKEPKPKEVCV